MKVIPFEISGEDAIVDAAMDAFVYSKGYKDVVANPAWVEWNRDGEGEEPSRTIPNPVTKLEYARVKFGDFFRYEVAEYMKKEAKKQAESQAEGQAFAAMDAISIQLKEPQ